MAPNVAYPAAGLGGGAQRWFLKLLEARCAGLAKAFGGWHEPAHEAGGARTKICGFLLAPSPC